MLLYVFFTFYYLTLDLYYVVFAALTNPSSNTRMTNFFMLSYMPILPISKSVMFSNNLNGSIQFGTIFTVIQKIPLTREWFTCSRPDQN